MASGKILVKKEQIAAAGGVKAALQMTPRAMTAYEAVGSAPTEADGADVVVQIEIRNERELREALDAGAQSILLAGMSPTEVRRLTEMAKGFRPDCIVELADGGSPNSA